MSSKIRIKSINILLILSLLLFINSSIVYPFPLNNNPTNSTNPINPTNPPDFADNLFESGLYYDAVTEYKRYLFHNPESPDAGLVRHKIGVCYMEEKKWGEAMEFFENALNEIDADEELRYRTLLNIAEIYLREGKYTLARFEFNDMLESITEADKRAEILYWRGWSYLYQHKWGLAEREFKEAYEADTDGELAEEANALSAKSRKGRELPKKSPGMARWMSRFLPGSGQIYAGKVFDGVVSFLLNGAVIFWTADTVLKGRYVEGAAIFSFLCTRFYLGNTYSAHKLTVEYNERVNEEYLSSIEK